MKKAIVLTLVAATLLSLLAGCGKELTPIEKAQARAVEIGERYLNFEITGTEAREQLNSIKVPEVETGNGQIYLSADIGYLAFIIAKYDSTYEEIKEKVEWIASQDYTK